MKCMSSLLLGHTCSIVDPARKVATSRDNSEFSYSTLNYLVELTYCLLLWMGQIVQQSALHTGVDLVLRSRPANVIVSLESGV
jgi:hypothetical protein